MASDVGKKIRLWIRALLVFNAVMMGVAFVWLYVGVERLDIVHVISPNGWIVLFAALLYVWGSMTIVGLLQLYWMMAKAQAA